MHAEAVGKIVFSFKNGNSLLRRVSITMILHLIRLVKLLKRKKLLDPKEPSTPDAFGLVCGGMDKMGKMRYNIFVKLCVKM